MEPPVTDFALIESQKENIRPLAGGRSAATLGALFSRDKDDEEITRGIEKLQGEIEEAERREREGEEMEDGDLLDVYCRYTTFLLQHFPSSPARVLPHLESATRRFVDDPRFAQDGRYLRLWTLYARLVERREEVWAFLESRGIGTRHAGFYEEWSAALEGLNRKKKADDVYRLGIARRAAPLERLKNRHQAFLARIMAPPSGVVPDDPPEPAAPRRTALGSVGRASVSTQQQPQMQARGSSARNGAKMAIFSDAAGGAPEAPEPTPWDDFGTRDGRRKENTVEATPWRGETLKQGRVARTPKLEVFKDAGAASAVHSADVLGGLKPKTPLSEAEMLRADPLRHFDTAGVQNTVPQIPALPAPPSARKPPAKRQRRDRDEEGKIAPHIWEFPTEGAECLVGGKMQRRMFDWDVVFRAQEEWSFEEVRARKLGLLGKDWKELKDWERGWHRAGSSTPKVTKPAKRAPSPTLNTKLANEEVMSLFNQTIHGGKVRDPDFSDDDDDDDDEEDEGEEVAPLPTPLPRAPVSMMTPGGMVPPTPTPAPGNGPRKLNIFADSENNENDENAVPARKPKMAIFQETPARTPAPAPRRPLGATPLASKPAKPLVFQDETPRNVFAREPTPPQHHNENAPSENAQENAPQDENAPQGAYAYSAYEDENDYDRGHNLRHFGKISTMTPITERTFDYTMNTHRSVGDELAGASIPSDLAAVLEEDERSASARASPAEREVSRRVSDERRETGQGEPSRRSSDHRDASRVSEHDTSRRVSDSRDASHCISQDASRRISDQRDASRRDSQDVSRRVSDSRDTSRRVSDPREASRRISDQRDTSRRTSGPDVPSDSSSRRTSASSRFDPHTQDTADFSYSGAVDTAAFGVPEGYTIHRQVDAAATMMHHLEVVDRTEGDVSMRGVPEGADASMRKAPEAADVSMAAPDAQADVSMAAPAPDVSMAPREADVSVVREADVSMAPADASPTEIPNPCDPEDAAAILLQQIQPPLSALPLFFDRREHTSGRLAALQRAAKARSRRSSAASLRTSIAPAEDAYILDLGTRYEICSKLGEGGFGAVFLGLDVDARDAADNANDSDLDSDDEETDANHLVAIKVEKPGTPWEAVMLDRVHRRVGPELAASIIRPRGLHLFKDESYLLLDYSSQGTLLDVVNKATVWGIAAGTTSPSAPDELLALFFVAELLRLVEGLHAQDMIHGDLKIDNCLVRLAPIPASEGGASAWSAQYSPNGKGGWAHKGVCLIDFGRAADLTLFPAGRKQQFVADWKTDERDCVEMREGRPWSYETDYFGLAGVAYCLLFGKYIGTEVVSGKVKIDAALKRYWQTELWSNLFDLLLNPASRGALPITGELGAARAQIEEYLADNCQKNGKSLKQMLKRIELRAMERR